MVSEKHYKSHSARLSRRHSDLSDGCLLKDDSYELSDNARRRSDPWWSELWGEDSGRPLCYKNLTLQRAEDTIPQTHLQAPVQKYEQEEQRIK